MNVLSLFDGMSCGQIALEKSGINVDNYYASELDEYAIKVTQANCPNTVQLGDVTKWQEWDIDWKGINLLIGGSPCQGFSFAGKQLAFDDPRSKLFFVYVDILNHIKKHNHKVKFMLENVRMKKEYVNVISDQLGVEPVAINSALVSAQSRQRLYWMNWDVELPEDKGITLSDILESDMDYRPAAIVGRKLDENGKRNDQLNQKPVQCLEVQNHSKSRCLSTVSKDTVISNLPPGRYAASEYRENYRNLTPIECERLQTVPDNYTNHVSDSQRYRMLGNGWTVDVISHLFSNFKYRE